MNPILLTAKKHAEETLAAINVLIAEDVAADGKITADEKKAITSDPRD